MLRYLQSRLLLIIQSKNSHGILEEVFIKEHDNEAYMVTIMEKNSSEDMGIAGYVFPPLVY